MVVGDVVSDIGADNAVFTFQPAAGVEVVITIFSPDLTTVTPELFDGVITSLINSQNAAHNNGANYLAMKFFINNTRYIRLLALGAGNRTAIMGIQTQ